jgi:M6 family metalloprotease-like protein
MRNKNSRKFIFTVITAIGMFSFSIAAPHNGDAHDLVQPDGTKVPVLVWGDEFYQHVESPDGYTLVRDSETDWICYAELSADSSELVPTGNIYRPQSGLGKAAATVTDDQGGSISRHIKLPRKHRLEKHRQTRNSLQGAHGETGLSNLSPAAPGLAKSTAKAAVPRPAWVKRSTGRFTGLTILIDFSDKEGTMPIETITDFVNKQGYTGFGNNGSVRDFYYDVSGGKVIYENIVVGYYRAKKPKTYYDSREAMFGDRAQELIIEALEWLVEEGFDFNQVTTYASSVNASHIKIQALNILYAGTPSMGWSEGLWPHQSRVNSIKIGDIYADIYQISDIGTRLSIGTFCHENGHMLFFWPDLYDYGGESGGVGVFCLMCNTGTTNPVPPCAYLRDFSRWDAVTDITGMPGGTRLTQLPANTNTSFAYRNESNPDELFYIEARRPEGRFSNLPGAGFLIWHVDQNGSNEYEQGSEQFHYQVSLEQADNQFQLEYGRNAGDRNDFFRDGYKDRFDDVTEPDAHWWDGSSSGMKIYNMSDVADTMSFTIGEAADTYYTIHTSASPNGFITPPGNIYTVAGSTLSFVMQPDSGYLVDAITVDGTMVATVDTLVLENIDSDHTIAVTFGLDAPLSVVLPQENAVLYAGDTTTILWRTRGVTVTGINASYSTDEGETFTPIASGLTSGDTLITWILPVVESEKCLVKVVDTDGNPEAVSGIFTIRKRPSIVVSTDPLKCIIGQGTSGQYMITIDNGGTGDLNLTVAAESQIRSVLINELFVGSDDENANDGIEIWNSGGTDIDLSGWKLSWAYMEQTNESYTFPYGFVLKGGKAIFLDDKEHGNTDSTAYLGTELMWSYVQGLELSVSLSDADNRGIDFMKTAGSPDLPPEGTLWRGSGIELSDAYVYRVNALDTDTLSDWTCGSTGSVRRINAQQQPSVHPLITLSSLNGKTPAGERMSLTLTVDAVERDRGDYYDTIVIHHNDPEKESPIRIPCLVSVVDPAKITAERMVIASASASPPVFIAAPNPVPPGDGVFFSYLPKGDERSGKLLIYNSIGSCLFSDEVDFSEVSVFNRQPLRFSWLPRNSYGDFYRRGTCLARLVIKRKDGTKSVFSTKVGLR